MEKLFCCGGIFILYGGCFVFDAASSYLKQGGYHYLAYAMIPLQLVY